MLSLLKYVQKATIIESIKAEPSTVNDLKMFYPGLLHNKIIQEFIKIKFVTLTHRMLRAGNICWTLQPFIVLILLNTPFS